MCVSSAIAKQLRRDLDLAVMWLEQSITHTLKAELTSPWRLLSQAMANYLQFCTTTEAGNLKLECTRLRRGRCTGQTAITRTSTEQQLDICIYNNILEQQLGIYKVHAPSCLVVVVVSGLTGEGRQSVDDVQVFPVGNLCTLLQFEIL